MHYIVFRYNQYLNIQNFVFSIQIKIQMFELACFPDFPKPRVVLCGRMDFFVILRSWSATPETVDEGSAHFPSEIIVQNKNSLCIYTICTLIKHKLNGYNFTVISRKRNKMRRHYQTVVQLHFFSYFLPLCNNLFCTYYSKPS